MEFTNNISSTDDVQGYAHVEESRNTDNNFALDSDSEFDDDYFSVASSPPTSPKLRAQTGTRLQVPWSLPEIPRIQHKSSIDSFSSQKSESSQRAAKLWQRVAKNSLNQARESDPWKGICSSVPTECAVEHVYDVKSETWKKVEVFVKLATSTPVAKGAMRECFQMKMRNPLEDAVSEKRVKLVDWFEIENFDVCDAFAGVGHPTARRIAAGIGVPCGYKNNSFTVGSLLAACEKNIVLVKSEIRKHVHNQDLAEAIVLELKALFHQYSLQHRSWRMPSLNYMAKRYMKVKPAGITHQSTVREILVRRPSSTAASPDDAYRVDVIMQQMCKELAKEYNQQTPVPPKLIDFLHVGLVEMVGRDEKPVFGYESYVPGDYHKWNTNAGWVDVERIRHTPHAFSFFTFRHTEGKVMVVDIQGVADIYTDPQIHTSDGNGFGDGNLGPRGMALFFNKFRYSSNPIVQYLGLKPFALAPGEQGEPSSDEIERFEEGKSYLESDAWKQRARRLGSQDFDADWQSSGTEYFDMSSLVAPEGDQVPLEAPVEALVHQELAKLHDEEDERVMEYRKCEKNVAVAFHRWWGAKLGLVPCIEWCAMQTSSDPTLSKETLKWRRLAAIRGSRSSMVETARLLMEGAAGEPPNLKDVNEAEQFLSTALETDDGLTDAERKQNFEVCNYEVLERRARIFAEHLNRPKDAFRDFMNGSEIAMQLGLFKVSTRLQEVAEEMK